MKRKEGPFVVGRPRLKTTSKNSPERILEDALETTERHWRSGIYASSAGLCARQTAGVMMIDPEHTSTRKASAQFYFKIGNAFEKVVEEALQKEDLLIDRETRISSYHPDLDVSGRVDFIFKDPDFDDEMSLIELKTCGKLPSSPKHPHLAQLMVYLVLTGAPRGYLWYISRNVAGWDGNVIQKSFLIEPSDKEREETLLTMALGATYLKSNNLPQIPPHMKRYKCGFCPLQNLCWNGDDSYVFAEPTLDPEAHLVEAIKITEDFMSAQNDLWEMFCETLTVFDKPPLPKIDTASTGVTTFDVYSTGVTPSLRFVTSE